MDTPWPPNRTQTPFEPPHHLDDCSESLSVISKIAAVYVQLVNDLVTQLRTRS